MAEGREELEIRTADGAARAWFHGGGAPRPAVLLYVDAFGVRPSMHAVAERLARLGYLVLLPDVFYRAGSYPPFDPATVWSDPPERDRLMRLIHSLTPERVALDARAYLDALRDHPAARADRVGVMGYCMGGKMAFLTAGQHPGELRAAACFHAGGLATDKPDSPHLLADRIQAAVYLGVADGDAGCTPVQQGLLASALGAAHVAYRLELYQGKRHGFAVPDHVGAHDPEAEARHWRRLEEFFGEALG